MINHSLEIVQGTDKNDVSFTAFILCKTKEDKYKLEEKIFNKEGLPM